MPPEDAIPDVSVVIPSHNESGSLEELIQRIRAIVKQRPESFEVILVDDGSTDRSIAVIADLMPGEPEIQLVRLAGNQGQTAALAAGINRARGPITVTLDADLQNHPEDIPRLLDALDDDVDVVAGIRRERQDVAPRHTASRIANWLIGRLTGAPLLDIGCTLRAYRTPVLRRVPLIGDAHRLLLVSLAVHRARIRQIEVAHSPRRSGVSHYGWGRVPRVLLDLGVALFLKRYLTRPMHLFGSVGAVLIGAGVAVIVTAVVLRLGAGVALISTPLILLAAVLGLLGMLAIMLGLVSEILVRIYFGNGSSRPYVLIAED